jgi:hypothetical protein
LITTAIRRVIQTTPLMVVKSASMAYKCTVLCYYLRSVYKGLSLFVV